MATQTGSIDLTASNGVKLMAEAGFENIEENYATKGELDVQADRIGMVVANNDASSSLQLTADAMTYIGNNVTIKGTDGTTTAISGGRIQANSLSIGAFDSAAQSATLNSNISVGGRNYILDSAGTLVSGLGSAAGSRKEYQFLNVGQSYMDIPHGTQVTISFDLYMTVNTANPTILVYNTNTNRKGPKAFSRTPVGDGTSSGVTKSFTAEAGSVIDERVSVTGYINDRETVTESDNFLEFYSTYGSSNWFSISNLKLEVGNTATDWTPAPEDVDSAISDAAKTATNYIGIDSTGIRIANANPSTATTYQHLTATNTEFVASGNTVATFGSTITLGNAASGSVVTIDSDSMDMVHGTNEMMHFGYGMGTGDDGTAVAPYYTIGTRAANSTVGNYSVVEGRDCTASAAHSHAEGMHAIASGSNAHAEGLHATASAMHSHAEGSYTTASGMSAHAEGTYATASAMFSHAEGDYTIASGSNAHAEGSYVTASGVSAHAEGEYATASGNYSHAQNMETVAASESQTALGRYNVADANNTYAVIVGNGTDDNARSNALTVDWDGNVAHGVDIPWTNLQLESSVESYSAGWTPRYRKWGPVVQVLGAVKLKSNQSAGFNVSISTLPSGCRPPVQVSTICQGSGNSTWLCNITTGGVMNIERYRDGGTSASATTSTWFPFSITFLTA